MTIITTEINAVKERLLRLKPAVEGIIATARGWEKKHIKGGTELLVSFPGLADLLNDVSPEVVVPVEPPVVTSIPEPAIEPVVESAPEVVARVVEAVVPSTPTVQG